MYVDIRKVISEYDPDVVGISILASSTANHANPIAKIAKEHNPNICTLFGGVSASVMTLEEIEESLPNVDAVCYSEGEIPISELFAAPDFFAELESNDAFITHVKAKTGTFVPTVKILFDLDQIPILPLDMLDTDSYENSVLALDGRKSIVMHTVRGCPFACNFCSATGIFGRNLFVLCRAEIEYFELDIAKLRMAVSHNRQYSKRHDVIILRVFHLWKILDRRAGTNE
ncbi:hypothetical protein ES708_22797 [subsurface metagenome]